jgi:hypothetical protein
MSRQRQEKPGRKAGNEEDRRARSAQALRANLLKRKAQAKGKAPAAKDGDEGRQD